MEKPRLLYIITQPEWGGAQHYIFDLATSLNDEFDITVATGRVENSKELIAKLESKGIKTHIFQNLIREIRPWTDFMGFIEITLFLNSNKFDIVHLNSSKAGVIGSLCANLNNVKKIFYTAHGWVFNEPLPLWKKKFYKLAEKISAKSLSNIITLSKIDTEIGALEKIAKPDKFIQIYNGIKLSDPLPREIAISKINEKFSINLAANQKIIGTITNFYKTKGLKYLITAWNDVIQKFPDSKLIIFGEGDLRNKLEKQIEAAHLENSILLPGSLTNAAKYLKILDIFVLSSVKEGLPYVIFEAMQAKLPIIATAVGGIPEMIENNVNGLLISPADPHEISDSINKILNNPELGNKLSENAYQTVNQKFSFQKMIEETKNLYLK